MLGSTQCSREEERLRIASRGAGGKHQEVGIASISRIPMAEQNPRRRLVPYARRRRRPSPPPSTPHPGNDCCGRPLSVRDRAVLDVLRGYLDQGPLRRVSGQMDWYKIMNILQDQSDKPLSKCVFNVALEIALSDSPSSSDVVGLLCRRGADCMHQCQSNHGLNLCPFESYASYLLAMLRHLSSQSCHEEMMKRKRIRDIHLSNFTMLLASGADPNVRIPAESSPVLSSCSRDFGYTRSFLALLCMVPNCVSFVQTLVNFGADPNPIDLDPSAPTPLQAVAQTLCKHYRQRTCGMDTILTETCVRDEEEKIRLLVSAGAYFDDYGFQSPAVREKHNRQATCDECVRVVRSVLGGGRSTSDRPFKRMRT